MTKREIMEAIHNMTNDEFISLWNECNDENGNTNSKIYKNCSEFLDSFFHSPSDAVSAAEEGNYHSYDDYVIFNSYGILESFNYWQNCYGINENILANWLMKNPKKAEKYIIKERKIKMKKEEIKKEIMDELEKEKARSA